MKTLPSALATHVALGTTTLAYLLKITRKDAQVFAFTSASVDAVVAGVTYRSSPGLDISSIVLSAGLAVDNLELTTLDDGSTFSRLDVLSGVWRNAAFLISRYNFASVADGTEPLLAGTIGEVRLQQGSIVGELRGLQQFLQQPIINVTSKTCRARLGDALCSVNLATYTFTGTLTGVTSKQVITDTARVEATDYFADGIFTFTSGNNTGLSGKVKTSAAGVLTMMLPFLQTPLVGDTYSISAGCQKRLAEDCIAKFNNVLNFQGEPHLPGVDTLLKPV